MSRPYDLQDISFTDPKVQECPYPAYQHLLREAPAYFDRRAGSWVVTHYHDIRKILLDPEHFSSAVIEEQRDTVNFERAQAARRLYEAEGWQPTPTLSLLDNPRHKEIREIFHKALRPGKIKEPDPFIRDCTQRLIDAFIGKGHCEAVAEFSVPLPLTVICSQVGVPIDDIWTIKRWTDAWVRRFSMMQSMDSEADCVRKEIEFQKYFVDIVGGLRKTPNGSVLSDLVNYRLTDGSQLSYAEIVTHLMVDVFVGGSETTTNAISEGILMLCRNPDQYALLNADLDRHLPNFIEETLRLETPVQGLYRVNKQDVEIRGVKIPARSLINLRFAAGNRDAEKFPCPEAFDIQRENSAQHIAFGSGIHSCIGAPLARREMLWAFDSLLRRCTNIRLVPEANDFTHTEGMLLRSLKSLQIQFDAA